MGADGKGFALSQGHQTVAYVAWREHLKFLAQPAGASTIVADGDDRSEVGDCPAGTRNRDGAIGNDAMLEACKKPGKAGTAAHGNYVHGI